MPKNDTLTEDSYRKLKREVDDAKTEADRAKGALEQLLKQLKSEFECDDLKEAKVKLEELDKAKAKAQRKFDEALAQYEEKWRKE